MANQRNTRHSVKPLRMLLEGLQFYGGSADEPRSVIVISNTAGSLLEVETEEQCLLMMIAIWSDENGERYFHIERPGAGCIETDTIVSLLDIVTFTIAEYIGRPGVSIREGIRKRLTGGDVNQEHLFDLLLPYTPHLQEHEFTVEQYGLYKEALSATIMRRKPKGEVFGGRRRR